MTHACNNLLWLYTFRDSWQFTDLYERYDQWLEHFLKVYSYEMSPKRVWVSKETETSWPLHK